MIYRHPEFFQDLKTWASTLDSYAPPPPSSPRLRTLLRTNILHSISCKRGAYSRLRAGHFAGAQPTDVSESAPWPRSTPIVSDSACCDLSVFDRVTHATRTEHPQTNRHATGLRGAPWLSATESACNTQHPAIDVALILLPRAPGREPCRCCWLFSDVFRLTERFQRGNES